MAAVVGATDQLLLLTGQAYILAVHCCWQYGSVGLGVLMCY